MFKPIVPDNFNVPQELRTQDFLIRPLTITDVDQDYEAVMSSIDHLQGVFGPNLNWPSPSLTKEEDLANLGWHQTEFVVKTSFAYTVFDPTNTKCLGCVYIFPSDKKKFDVEVYLWVRQSHALKFDTILYETIKTWIKNSWPFKFPCYPGRSTSWTDYSLTL